MWKGSFLQCKSKKNYGKHLKSNDCSIKRKMIPYPSYVSNLAMDFINKILLTSEEIRLTISDLTGHKFLLQSEEE